jgi:hypothetical protein
MKTVLIALLALSLAPAPALADRSYNSERNVTHDCAKDPEVSVNVSGGTYTFTGKCDKISLNGAGNTVKVESVKKLAVNGSKNTVSVDAVDKLSVNGSDNTVNYKRGVSGKPKVASLGTNNKLNLVK